MNILYLLDILKTDKLSILVENIDLPMLDINLAIWDAEAEGLVKIDTEKDKITPLTDEFSVTCDEELKTKIVRVMQHYQRRETNLNRGRLNMFAKTQQADYNIPYHEYLMALHSLLDNGEVIQIEVTVPEIKDVRPYHRFAFLCFPDNPHNEEWNSREVNNWMKNWDSNPKKKVAKKKKKR